MKEAFTLALLAFLFIGAVVFGIATYVVGAPEKNSETLGSKKRRTGLATIFGILGTASVYFGTHFIGEAFSSSPPYLPFFGGPSALAYALLLVVSHMIAKGVPKLSRIETAHFIFKSIEITLLGLGLAIALHEASRAIDALRENAESNRMIGRGQLYQTDLEISKIESAKADGKLLTLYANSSPTCSNQIEARKYITDLLSLVSDDQNIINSKDVDTIYEQVFGAGSYNKFDKNNLQNERPDVVELRRMSNHCIMLLDMIHSAYDYWGEKVMETPEFETWAGYFSDIGPHPVWLMTIRNWEQRPYMSRWFAQYVHYRLWVDADDSTRRVVLEFYPELAKETFGMTLPKYGHEPKDLFHARKRKHEVTSAEIPSPTITFAIPTGRP